MKHYAATLLAIMVIGTSAFASGNNNQGSPHSNASSFSAASAAAKSTAIGVGVGLGGNGGNAKLNQDQTISQNVTVKGGSTVIQERPVSTAVATGLAASNGTCMGSTSVGGQGVGLGLSFGTTWKDEDCNRRYFAEHLDRIGHPAVAFALLCQNEGVAAAAEAVGVECPAIKKPAKATPNAGKFDDAFAQLNGLQ